MAAEFPGIPRGLRHVATVTTGSALAQFILLLVVPLLTRLYSPSDFGGLALYVGTISVLGTIVAGRYELAIPLPVQRTQAAALYLLSNGIALLVALTVLVIVSVYRARIANFVEMPELEPWLWLVPLSLVLWGAFQSLTYWSTRHQRFRAVAVARIGQATSTGGMQLLLGLFGTLGFAGLIVGQLFGAAAAMLLLAVPTLSTDMRILFSSGSRTLVPNMARQYSRLAAYAFPTTFSNALSSHALPLLVIYYFGVAAGGLALLAQRAVLMPILLVSGATWQVVHARLGQLDAGGQRELLVKIHRVVCLSYAFPVSCLIAFSDFAEIVLGRGWDGLADILPAIGIMAYINGVSNATSYFAAFGEYRAEAATNLGLLIVRVASLVIGARYLGFVAAIYAYALVSALVYLGVNTFWGIKLGVTRILFLNLISALLISGAIVAPIELLSGGRFWVALLSASAAATLYYSFLWRRYLSTQT